MTGEKFSMDIVPTTRLELKLGEAADGSIDPASRELDADTLSAVERDVLGGRFDIAVVEGTFLPCGCIDGRCPHDEAAFNPVPNASGGTLSLLVGELLTNESNLARTAETSEEALASLIKHLQDLNLGDQIGGHTAPAHGSDTASGCGANDALKTIFGQMVEKPEIMLSVLDSLNIPVDKQASFPSMIKKASGFLGKEGYFVPGLEVAKTLQSSSVDGNCPRLEGGHNEVMIRLNTQPGTTLDRRALRAAYGDEYQVFNVDVWSLKQAAETLSETAEEADNKFAAMVMYQVATALQLCGPGMRVILR